MVIPRGFWYGAFFCTSSLLFRRENGNSRRWVLDVFERDEELLRLCGCGRHRTRKAAQCTKHTAFFNVQTLLPKGSLACFIHHFVPWGMQCFWGLYFHFVLLPVIAENLFLFFLLDARKDNQTSHIRVLNVLMLCDSTSQKDNSFDFWGFLTRTIYSI